MTSDSPSSSNARPTASGGVPDTVLAAIEAHLKQRELRREDLYQRARRLRRLAQSTMTRLHSAGTAAPELGGEPADLGVDPEPYLLGLGDVVGEVRRRVLDRLGRDDLPGAEADLALMERLTQALLRFDTTRAIVQLKPKQDTARTLLERTRGEVVMARFLSRARPADREGAA